MGELILLLLVLERLLAPIGASTAERDVRASPSQGDQPVPRDCRGQFGICKHHVGGTVTLADGLHPLLLYLFKSLVCSERYAMCLEERNYPDVILLEGMLVNLELALSYPQLKTIRGPSACDHFVIQDSTSCFDAPPVVTSPEFRYCMSKLTFCVQEVFRELKVVQGGTTVWPPSHDCPDNMKLIRDFFF